MLSGGDTWHCPETLQMDVVAQGRMGLFLPGFLLLYFIDYVIHK